MSKSASKHATKKGTSKDVPVAGATNWWPWQGLRHEFERMFGEQGNKQWPAIFGDPGTDARSFWRDPLKSESALAVDVVENDEAYEISAELPGLSDKDVEVKLSNGLLTIKGEKKEEKEKKEKDYHLSERRYGMFQRSFQVPQGVDVDKIAAKFTDGVLKITLPKSEEAKQQEMKIAIN